MPRQYWNRIFACCMLVTYTASLKLYFDLGFSEYIFIPCVLNYFADYPFLSCNQTVDLQTTELTALIIIFFVRSHIDCSSPASILLLTVDNTRITIFVKTKGILETDLVAMTVTNLYSKLLCPYCFSIVFSLFWGRHLIFSRHLLKKRRCPNVSSASPENFKNPEKFLHDQSKWSCRQFLLNNLRVRAEVITYTFR